MPNDSVQLDCREQFVHQDIRALQHWIIFESHIDGHSAVTCSEIPQCEPLLGLDSRTQIRPNRRLKRIFRRESLLTLRIRLCAENKVSQAKIKVSNGLAS